MHIINLLAKFDKMYNNNIPFNVFYPALKEACAFLRSQTIDDDMDVEFGVESGNACTIAKSDFCLETFLRLISNSRFLYVKRYNCSDCMQKCGTGDTDLEKLLNLALKNSSCCDQAKAALCDLKCTVELQEPWKGSLKNNTTVSVGIRSVNGHFYS
uniref:Uncharacterized protein n=1 Tax=Trichobilharzia regenti TaxID=157069 RepID=A0AA85JCM6_TRIRE|nr:unnamed protein product [Trichobilharzia regenti]